MPSSRVRSRRRPRRRRSRTRICARRCSARFRWGARRPRRKWPRRSCGSQRPLPGSRASACTWTAACTCGGRRTRTKCKRPYRAEIPEDDSMPAIDPSRYEMIKVSAHEGVATLVLNNPARKNGVTRQMHSELERIWDDIDADDDLRVTILTGEAGTFCAGTDLGVQQKHNEEGRRGRPRTRPARRIFWNMLDCEKPIIAKVRGYAYGLGVNIALSCDLVYAAEGAKFCDSHVKMGIAPGDGGAALWPLLIGFA